MSPWEQPKVDFGKRLISYSLSVGIKKNVTELYQTQGLYEVSSLKVLVSCENIHPKGCSSSASEVE